MGREAGAEWELAAREAAISEPDTDSIKPLEVLPGGKGNAVSWLLGGLADSWIHFPKLVLAQAICVLAALLSLVTVFGPLLVGPAMACGFLAVVVGISRKEDRWVKQLFEGFRVLGTALAVSLVVAAPGIVIVLLWAALGMGAILSGSAGVTGVLIALGLMSVLVPAYVSSRLAFAQSLVVDRKLGMSDCLLGSWRMTSGSGLGMSFFGFSVLRWLAGGLMTACFGGVILALWKTLNPTGQFDVATLVPLAAIGFAGLCIAWAGPFLALGYAYNDLLPAIGQGVPAGLEARRRFMPGMLLTGALLAGGLVSLVFIGREGARVGERRPRRPVRVYALEEAVEAEAEAATEKEPTEVPVATPEVPPATEAPTEAEPEAVEEVEATAIPEAAPEEELAEVEPAPEELPPRLKTVEGPNGTTAIVFDPEAGLLPLYGGYFEPAPDFKRILAYDADPAESDRPGKICVYESPPVTGRLISGKGLGPVWSPDGGLIAYDNKGICIAAPDGTLHRRLTESDDSASWISWSPDGRCVMYADRRGGLYSVSVGGKNHRQLLKRVTFSNAGWVGTGEKARLLVPGFVGNQWQPLWVKHDGRDCRGLAITSVSGGSLLNKKWLVYGVSRDGNTIALATSPGGVSLLDVPGKRWIILDESGSFPKPSPDGQWVAYRAGRALTIIRRDGRQKMRIERDLPPLAWSADGRWVYVFDEFMGEGRLVAFDWQRKVERDVLGLDRISSPRVEEDGRYVTFKYDLDPEIWGGEPSFCRASLESSSPVIDVIWPRRGEIRLDAWPGEVSIADEVAELGAGELTAYGAELLRIELPPMMLPTALAELSQGLELSPDTELPEEMPEPTAEPAEEEAGIVEEEAEEETATVRSAKSEMLSDISHALVAGRRLEQQGEIEEARRVYTEVIERYPDAPQLKTIKERLAALESGE